MIQLQAASHVRYRSDEHGGIILLDTTSGNWLALNPTAGDLWRRWDAGTEFEASVAAVAARYPGTCPQSIRADAERLLDEVVTLRLMDAAPRQPPSEVAMAEQIRGSDSPGALRVGIAYFCVMIASFLLRCSFRVPLAVVRACHRCLCRTTADAGAAGRAVAAVSTAARRYPGRAACLEQSLAAVLFSVLRGRTLTWCLGAAADPYRFHAWVESGGQPVPVPGQPPGSSFQRVLAA
jgi:hypothetical protein